MQSDRSFFQVAGNWLHRNLFSSWLNSLLTLVCFWGIYQLAQWAIVWLFTKAQWAVVQANLGLLLTGRYPTDQAWKLWLLLGLFLGFVVLLALRDRLLKRFPLLYQGLPWVGLGGLPLAFWWVGANAGGLVLTLFLAIVSIGLAFPLGVLLALGRRSDLPIIRGFCILYIELIRGLPLIGILFMAQVMLPLVLPIEVRPDRILRAIAGLVLFNAAYLAENVRGGLQSIPAGQLDAAKALGLNVLQRTWLIVLPQALRAVIPAIVGQFISLFKDTSLLAIFALLELTGMARSILAQPEFIGRYAEVYLFIGLIYWCFCYGMSQYSQFLERRLDVD